MDQWIEQHLDIIKHYRNDIFDEMRDCLSPFIDKQCEPIILPVSSMYDSFYGRPPSGRMSYRLSAVSRLLVQEELTELTYASE